MTRAAGASDAPVVARLLHDFNAEFGDYSPGVDVLTERLGQLLASADVSVLLAGEGPDGLVVLRFRPSFWTGAPDAYLEELYVAPHRRGRGIGRALLEATLAFARDAGAEHIDLATSVDDTAALALYESCGFTNREGRPDGPQMLYYERDL